MLFKFPAYQRLKKEEDFKNLLKNGKKIRNRFFFYFLQNDYPYHRFAVSVNRKVGNAVQRNYFKRVMKECFRLNRQLVEAEKNYDLWIIAKKRFDKTNAREIRELFIHSLKKINRR